LHFYGNNNMALEPANDPHDIIIERNFFYNNRNFNYPGGTGNAFLEDDTYNVTWRNNLIINPHHMGILTENVDDIFIYNNTIIAYPPLGRGGIFPLYIGRNNLSEKI